MPRTPFRLLPLVLSGLILAAVSARSQTLLFDFGGGNTTLLGGSPDDPDNYWNNITGTIGTATPGTPVAQLNAAVTTANVPTGINLVMVSRFNGVNEAGTLASTVFPTDATRDSLYGNTENFGAGTNFFPSFKLTGLDPGFNHTLTFYASRVGAGGDNRETLYTVSNGTSAVEVALNAAENIDSTVAVELIKPSAAGELTITLGPGPNNNNGFHFTYLGVMKLEMTPGQQQPVVFTDEPDDQTILVGRPVTFTAAVNSTPPYTIQWMQDDVPIPDATQFSYTIPAASLDMNNTRYSVKVSNLQYNATSRKALLRVSSDLTPPTIVSASSVGPFHMALVFSEEMDETFAEEPSNYLVDAGNIFLAAAELQADRKTVILTPGQPMAGTTQVAVSNITDLAGNSIAPDSPASALIPQPDGKSFLIDFGGGDTTSQGGGTDDRLNIWNNVTGGTATADGSVVPDLVRNNGDITGVSLTIVKRFNNVNVNGTLAPAPFPPDATRDTVYGNTADFNGLVDIYPVIRLGGLNPAEEHDILFYGSRMDAGENRETRYTVTGATETFVDYNVANNIVNTAVVTGMRPNEFGEITIGLTPGPNNVHPNRFTYLGVLKVTPRASTGPLEMLKPVIINGKIVLNWIGAGSLEWSNALTNGTWTPILPPPTSPYSEDVIPGQRKFFRLRP